MRLTALLVILTAAFCGWVALAWWKLEHPRSSVAETIHANRASAIICNPAIPPTAVGRRKDTRSIA